MLRNAQPAAEPLGSLLALKTNIARSPAQAQSPAGSAAGRAGRRISRLVVPLADHNTIFIAQPDLVWATLQQFVDHLQK